MNWDELGLIGIDWDGLGWNGIIWNAGMNLDESG